MSTTAHVISPPTFGVPLPKMDIQLIDSVENTYRLECVRIAPQPDAKSLVYQTHGVL